MPIQNLREKLDKITKTHDIVLRQSQIVDLLTEATYELVVVYKRSYASVNLSDEYLLFIKDIINSNYDLLTRVYESEAHVYRNESLYYKLTRFFNSAIHFAVISNNLFIVNFFRPIISQGFKPLLNSYIKEESLFEQLPQLYYRYWAKPQKNMTPFVESSVFEFLETHWPKQLHEYVNFQEACGPIRAIHEWALPHDVCTHKDFAKYLTLAPSPTIFLYIARTKKEAENNFRILSRHYVHDQMGRLVRPSQVKVITPEAYKLINHYALIVLETLAEYIISHKQEYTVNYVFFFRGGKNVTCYDQKDQKDKTIRLPTIMAKIVKAYHNAQKDLDNATSYLSQVMLLAAETAWHRAYKSTVTRDENFNPMGRAIATHNFYYMLRTGSMSDPTMGTIMENIQNKVKKRIDESCAMEARLTLAQLNVPQSMTELTLSYMFERPKPFKDGEVSCDEKSIEHSERVHNGFHKF